MHTSKKITLGFSPCPNDCFIFDALIHHKIDTQGFEFDVVMADVEELNRRAFQGNIDVTKLSYHAFAYLTNKYVLLDAGSALGYKCGPILICKTEEIKNKFLSGHTESLTVAIPGKYTTANLLFSIAFPAVNNKTEMLFSDIEEAVLTDVVDAGLIIHENRFTYEEKGLKKIIDLGEYWEQQTSAPIPLGGIVANRAMPLAHVRQISQIISNSVQYAFQNPKSSLPFVKAHAQEMSEEVMYKHIDLYVNQFSINLGREGREAVNKLFDKAKELKIVPEINHDIFSNN